jgi:acyl-CoA reductase-like NAD-dependent aldehyde dehydrogenase
MPRPRKYQSDSDRSAVYRERREKQTKRVDRAAVEALVAAVDAAAAAGDPIARQVRAGSVDALLRNLGDCFEKRAAALVQEPSASEDNKQPPGRSRANRG